jgi:hypothetical protein
MYEIIGWLLIVVAAIFIVLIVLHVESEKKLSFKFTIIAVIITAFCMGYGIHFFLLNAGL